LSSLTLFWIGLNGKDMGINNNKFKTAILIIGVTAIMALCFIAGMLSATIF